MKLLPTDGKRGGAHGWYGDRKQKDVLKFDRDGDTVHPTQKPVALLTYLITNSSKSEDVLLDLFGGSGSMTIAAEKTGRCCYSMELDPKYVDVIITRYCLFTGNNKIKCNNKEIEWKIQK